MASSLWKPRSESRPDHWWDFYMNVGWTGHESHRDALPRNGFRTRPVIWDPGLSGPMAEYSLLYLG